MVEFKFNYDNSKLVLLNDLDEEDENVLICAELPNKWENMCSVANDYDADAEEGTEVKPLNDGVINVNVCTTSTSKSNALTEDGQLVFEFKFKVNDNAEGDLGFVIPNATVSAAENTKDDIVDHAASGSYAVTKAPVVNDPSDPSDPSDPTKPGDASNMIIFAIIALVAIAGSAVVIKTRK